MGRPARSGAFAFSCGMAEHALKAALMGRRELKACRRRLCGRGRKGMGRSEFQAVRLQDQKGRKGRSSWPAGWGRGPHGAPRPGWTQAVETQSGCRVLDGPLKGRGGQDGESGPG